MPMTSATLRPGVNTLQTLAQNEAGVSASNLIRYQQGMIQKYGGWEQYYPFTISSTIRELWAWQSLTGDDYLAVGATQSLSVIHSNTNTDITPQTLTRDFTPNFSVSSGSNVVTVEDPGSSMSTYNTVYFNTPVAVGTLLINGAYRINSIGGSSAYTILATQNSCTTVASSGILPMFSATAGSQVIGVELPNNNFQPIPGLFQQFIAPTTVGSLTVQGPYLISTVLDSTAFTINASQQSTTTASSVPMNGGQAQAVYYITQGAAATGTGYGIGGYGLGGYGTGVAGGTGASGDPITATDWTLANWGDLLMGCPMGGPIYIWTPSGGFNNAQVISQAPFFNNGIFISMPQQILVAWGSVQTSGVQNPLRIRWSNAENYDDWTITSNSYAGGFTLPTGSRIMGGLQAPTQGIIWTDIDVWSMQYVGLPVVFNFTRIGSGCGLVGPHAASILNGQVYWMGKSNFFMISGEGMTPIPCPVWNFVFQNIDNNNLNKVRCAANSLFNEITWFFPAAGGNGENSLYVKYNILEREWDTGTLGRTAWVDVTILGNPIGSDTSGFIYQHDTGENDNLVPMQPYFETGYWAIADGNILAFVDWVLPDMQFGTYSGNPDATLQITFKAVDYPGDNPRIYGPYTYTQATDYINTRIRGRLMAMRVESSDADSFWRLGRIRYRYAPDGRR